ncbi:conserved hypothetical protein, membrane, partial [mine drainage metagenome]
MREKDRAKWERVRAKGKRRFVLMRGVLMWGLGTAILSSVLLEIEGVQSFHLWPGLPGVVLMFLFGGYFWGSWMWNAMERLYQ